MSTTTAAKKTAATRPEPPAAAVAQDAHWAAKMARLKSRRLAEQPIRLFDDPADKDALDTARTEADRAARFARDNPGDPDLAKEAEAAAKALQDLTARLDEVSVQLVFRALPGKRYEHLQAEYPPTEEQEADGWGFNADTFPPVLIAAACTDPMTVEEAQELLEAWGPADQVDVFAAAQAAQQKRRSDLGKG